MRVRPWVSAVAIRGMGASQPSRLHAAVLLWLLAAFAAPVARAADETSHARANDSDVEVILIIIPEK